MTFVFWLFAAFLFVSTVGSADAYRLTLNNNSGRIVEFRIVERMTLEPSTVDVSMGLFSVPVVTAEPRNCYQSRSRGQIGYSDEIRAADRREFEFSRISGRGCDGVPAYFGIEFKVGPKPGDQRFYFEPAGTVYFGIGGNNGLWLSDGPDRGQPAEDLPGKLHSGPSGSPDFEYELLPSRQ